MGSQRRKEKRLIYSCRCRYVTCAIPRLLGSRYVHTGGTRPVRGPKPQLDARNLVQPTIGNIFPACFLFFVCSSGRLFCFFSSRGSFCWVRYVITKASELCAQVRWNRAYVRSYHITCIWIDDHAPCTSVPVLHPTTRALCVTRPPRRPNTQRQKDRETETDSTGLHGGPHGTHGTTTFGPPPVMKSRE